MDTILSEKGHLDWEQLEGVKKQLSHQFEGNTPFNDEQLLDILKKVSLLPNQYFYLKYLPKKHVVYVSSSVSQILGYSDSEFDDHRLSKIIHPEDRAVVFAGISYAYSVANFKVFKPFELAIYFKHKAFHKNGDVKSLLWYISPISYDTDGKLLFCINVVTDISELHLSERVQIWGVGLPEEIPQFSMEGYYNSSKLTKREKDILFYLSKGLNSKSISEKLFLSRHTIDTHRRNMLRKMEVKNTGQLMRKAINLGLLFNLTSSNEPFYDDGND
jgi:PAS domain S-box-containing protein